MSQMHDVIQELERVIAMLRDSRNCGEWVVEMEQRLVGLRAVDGSQRQAVVALRERCHQQALGDALTNDDVSYMLQVAKLREVCDRAITGYDEAVV
jgi:hypothetical protein